MNWVEAVVLRVAQPEHQCDCDRLLAIANRSLVADISYLARVDQRGAFKREYRGESGLAPIGRRRF